MQLIIERQINQAVEEVFDLFTDLEKAAERIRGIKSLEVLDAGPVGVGTRFRETRTMFKRDSTEEMMITGFEPGRSYVVGSENCGCEYLTEFRFHEQDGGTHVRVEMRTRPVSIFARMMAPLGKLMMGSVVKMFEEDLDDLQAVAEGRA